MKVLQYVAILACFCATAFADSLVTRPQAAMMALTKALERYAKSNDGKMPTKLSDLDAYFVASLERQLGARTLDENIILVTRDVKMIAPNRNTAFDGGQILAVTASSIGEDRREQNGRYVIWKNPKGDFRTAWLNEEDIKAQFVAAGTNLPTSPSLQEASTLEASPDYMMRRNAKENFKDPNNPTAQEVEIMKRDIAERYGDKIATPAPAAVQTPIVPVAIIGIIIMGVTVFLIRRRFP